MAGDLEVADVFRRHGPAFRAARSEHIDRDQRRVMGAIEACRTAALGGHVRRCADCGHAAVAYNSCRNRHCPKRQGPAREAWVAARRAELLPAPYFHVVFTVPAPVGAIAFQNKAAVYAILFRAAAQALRVIAAEPRHLGAEIGGLAVLHSWGQAEIAGQGALLLSDVLAEDAVAHGWLLPWRGDVSLDGFTYSALTTTSRLTARRTRRAWEWLQAVASDREGPGQSALTRSAMPAMIAAPARRSLAAAERIAPACVGAGVGRRRRPEARTGFSPAWPGTSPSSRASIRRCQSSTGGLYRCAPVISYLRSWRYRRGLRCCRAMLPDHQADRGPRTSRRVSPRRSRQRRTQEGGRRFRFDRLHAEA
jgi:hypothetical protein